MKVVKKNVYYCDHCKKKGLSALHIRNHEARCTGNPKRLCGCCGRVGISEGVESFTKRFTLADNPLAYPTFDDGDLYDPTCNHDEKIVTWIGEPITIKEVRELADDCPACILAILRQTGMNRHYFHFEGFDFKKELAKYRLDHQERPDPYCYM